MVKIHVVDENTGQYVKKDDRYFFKFRSQPLSWKCLQEKFSFFPLNVSASRVMD